MNRRDAVTPTELVVSGVYDADRHPDPSLVYTRAGFAPINTQYTTSGTAAGEGGHIGGVGMSQRRGPGIESRTNDPNQTFGVENPFEPFASDPVKPSQAAINPLNNALAASKSGHEKEQLTAHWLQYVGSAQNGTPAAQHEIFPGKQE